MHASHEQLYAAARTSLAQRPQSIMRELYERQGLIPTRHEVQAGRAELDLKAKLRTEQLKAEHRRLQERYDIAVRRLEELRTISGADSDQSS